MTFYKNIFTCFFVISTFFSVYSQNLPQNKVSVKWGKEHPSQTKLSAPIIVGKDDVSFFALEASRNTVYLTKYNNELSQIDKMTVELKGETGERDFENIFLGKNNKFYLLSSQKKQKTNTVFVEALNKTPLKLNGSVQKLAEIPYNVRDYHRSVPQRIIKKQSVEGSFIFVTSKDSSKYGAILLSTLDFTKNDKEKFSINVLDDNMKPLWNKSVELPYDDELFEISLTKVSNEGDIYIVGKLYNEKAEDAKKGKPNYKYQILKFSRMKNNPEIIDVNINDKFVNNLVGTFEINGDLTINGYYSTKGEEYRSGLFYMVLDTKTKNIKAQTYQKFTFFKKALEKQNKSGKQEKEIEFTDIYLKNVIRRDDGNTILVGENVSIATFSGTSPITGLGSYSQDAYYTIIYLISINSKGEINWSEAVPKAQISKGTADFMSYGIIINDKIHLVFNDDIDNTKNRFADNVNFDSYTGEKNSAVVMVTVDDNGKLSEITIFNNKKEDTRAYPRLLFQTDLKSVIMPGKIGKNQKFASIKLQ